MKDLSTTNSQTDRYIITDIILTRSDESVPTTSSRHFPKSCKDYFRSLLDHRAEIVSIAIADFQIRFPNSPLQPDNKFSDISGDNAVLLSKELGEDIVPVATYGLSINRTDSPGRVELHFVSDDRES